MCGLQRVQTCESGDHDKERTAMACDVYVEVRVLEARSNMKIWPLSTDNATREPSGLYTASTIYRKTMRIQYLHDCTAFQTYRAHSVKQYVARRKSLVLLSGWQRFLTHQWLHMYRLWGSRTPTMLLEKGYTDPQWYTKVGCTGHRDSHGSPAERV
jgi:hypothetical protein